MLPDLNEILRNATAIYASIAVVVLTSLYYAWKNRGIPPGPIGLPYLGYLPFLNPELCHLQLQEFGKKYGWVFSMKSAGRLYINLGSIKAMREALVTKSDHFQQRVDEPNLIQQHLDGGVLFLRGEQWKTVRKCFLQLFRERGMTVIKDSLSGPMYDTIRSTVVDLKNKNGEPVDISQIILLKGCIIMRQTLFGEDGMSDEELIEFNKGYSKFIQNVTGHHTFISGPLFKYFYLPFSKGLKEADEGSRTMKRLLTKAIEKRKSTYNDSLVRDLIDGYFKERNTRRSKNDPTAKYFTDSALMLSLIQIVGDGILFLSIFVSAFIKALVDRPEEQEKIYRELLEVVGEDRDPSMEDKSKLTYTNAFISEVLRTTDLLSLFPTLECGKETTIQGYRIPKGAVLVYNFFMAHQNPDDFEEPEKFNPSRYITTDRNKRPELPAIFGIGKRTCIGEGFTMTQVFLYLTTLVKNFKLKKPENAEEVPTLFYLFNSYNICAQPRH